MIGEATVPLSVDPIGVYILIAIIAASLAVGALSYWIEQRWP